MPENNESNRGEVRNGGEWLISEIERVRQRFFTKKYPKPEGILDDEWARALRRLDESGLK